MTKPLNLDLLGDHSGTIIVFGEERPVMHFSGADYRTYYNFEHGADVDVLALYAIVGRLVPSLSPEQLDRLTLKQVGAIIGVAGAPIRAVEESFPNSDGPATSGTPAQES